MTVTQFFIPAINFVNWSNVGNGNISINVSYPYFSLNTLYESLHRGFTFSLPWFNITSWSGWSLIFALSEGIMSSLKPSATTLLPENKRYITMIITHNHSWCTARHTTLEHQVLFLLLQKMCTTWRKLKGLSSDSSNNLELYDGSWSLKIFNTHSCDISMLIQRTQRWNDSAKYTPFIK